MDKGFLKDQLIAAIRNSLVKGADLKDVLRSVVGETWPGLPPWSTLKHAVIEEDQKGSASSGVVLTFMGRDGKRKVVLGQAGDHYKKPGVPFPPAYTIPGGFINLTETPGSSCVPQSDKPENIFIGAAREIEEEFRLPDGAPLFRIDPARLKPMDALTLGSPVRLISGLMMELNDDEVMDLNLHLTLLQNSPNYKEAVAEQTINPASGLPEISDIAVFDLDEVAEGRVNLLHSDQKSLFRKVRAFFDLLRGILPPPALAPIYP